MQSHSCGAWTLARRRYKTGRSVSELTRRVSAQFENTFEIRADLPGMSKNDIQVHVDNDVVTVSVEKEDKRGEDKEEQGVR